MKGGDVASRRFVLVAGSFPEESCDTTLSRSLEGRVGPLTSAATRKPECDQQKLTLLFSAVQCKVLYKAEVGWYE